MADFRFNLRTHSPDVLDVVSTAFGNDGLNKYTTEADTGKAMVLAGEGFHDLAGADDEITGFIDSVKGDTVNELNSFGGLQRGGTRAAVLGANQGATPAKVGDLVVADEQSAAGVKPADSYIKIDGFGSIDIFARVKVGSPTNYKWQIIRVIGDGLAGSTVYLERLR